MPDLSAWSHRFSRGWGGITTAVVVFAIVASLLAVLLPPVLDRTNAQRMPATITDVSGSLGSTFHPGVILSGASNGTTTLLGGIGVYSHSTGFTLPVFAALTASPTLVANETARVASYFFEGGVYAIGWNGSSWLIGGQRSPGGADLGALVTLHDGTVTNLTAQISSYFTGGGIWSIGWNGTSWLIGGNSSAAATLLAWNGASLTDLSSRVKGHGPAPWIQMITWNGAEWLLGGHGVFGLWSRGTFVDLFPSSPFQNGGVYSAGWDGADWLVGGGGRELVWVHSDGETVATTLPQNFDQVVLMILWTGHGWFVAGKGQGTVNGFSPALGYWSGSSTAVPLDYTTNLPASFDGGEVQGGVPAPEFGAGTVILVGEGGYDPSTGFGIGATALLTPT